MIIYVIYKGGKIAQVFPYPFFLHFKDNNNSFRVFNRYIIVNLIYNTYYRLFFFILVINILFIKETAAQIPEIAF